MDPSPRETMLMRGDMEEITGFSFTSMLNLEARDAKDVMAQPDAAIGFVKQGVAIINEPLEKRRLRPGHRTAFGPDGQPDLGRLGDQDTGAARRSVEQQLPAE